MVTEEELENFKRQWNFLKRNGRFKDADQFRRAWNRYCYAQYEEGTIPNLGEEWGDAEEVVNLQDGQATARKKYYYPNKGDETDHKVQTTL